MSELSTIARPYAKALFDLASEGGDYSKWSDILGLLDTVVSDPAVQALIEDPFADRRQLIDLIKNVCGEAVDSQAQNLLEVLAENGRLGAVGEIADRFESLRAQAESTIEAEVESALPMDDEQLAKLAVSLETHFGKKVKLNPKVNEALMGGVVIRAGDTVIDGSVRTKLEKLASTIRA